MAWPSGPGPNPPALALALGALLLARRAPVGAGALAGLAVFVRPEIGVAAVLGAMLEARGSAGGEPRRRGAGRIALAALVVAVLAFAPFAIVAGGDMADQVLGFASKQDLQRLPFPLGLRRRLRPEQAARVLPARDPRGRQRAVGGLGARAPRRLRPGAPGRGRARSTCSRAPTSSTSCRCRSPWPSRWRARPAARRSRRHARRARAWRSRSSLVHGLERRAGQALHPPALAAIPAQAADGVRTAPADAAALRGLIPYVRARAPGGAPVLVAPPRYDRVRVGDPMLNVLLDRPNPTRYDVVQPGVVTTAKVQREMARDLRSAPVVVRWLSALAREREPNGSARSSGVFVLDRAIARGYRPAARFGDYVVLGAPIGVDGEPSGMRPSTSSMAAEPTVIRGACPHDCPDTCAWEVTVRDGVAEKLVGVKDHPVHPRRAVREGQPLPRAHVQPRSAAPAADAHGPQGLGRLRAGLLGRRARRTSPSAWARSSPSTAARPCSPTASPAPRGSCRAPRWTGASSRAWAPAAWSARSAGRRPRPGTSRPPARSSACAPSTSSTAASSCCGGRTRSSPTCTSGRSSSRRARRERGWSSSIRSSRARPRRPTGTCAHCRAPTPRWRSGSCT